MRTAALVPSAKLRRPFLAWAGLRGLLLVCSLLLPALAPATEYRQLPPPAPVGLTDQWLIHDVARNRLILYLPGYHAPAHAYYQYVSIRRGQPFPVAFAAAPGLSLFLDNQLLFTARRAATYTLNLADLLPTRLANGPHLLAAWQPSGSPALSSFRAGLPTPATAPNATAPVVVGTAQPRLPAPQGQNIYLGFLLLIGLVYGGIRSTFQSGMARIFQFSELFGNANDQQSFLVKPAFTLVNLALVLLFSLSFALLLTAIHTDLSSLPLLRRFLDVPETAIVARILLYTALIATFVFGKYLYLELMGYIFDVQELVNVQYREFLRTTLLASLLLPLVLLFHLSLNTSLPRTVSWAASGVIVVLLAGTSLRVTRTLQRRSSLLNLHLFAYLCATEVLPLLVVLRLIVFSY